MKTNAPKVTIVPGSAGYLESLFSFARLEYGRSSHQTLASFYNWQYERNPNCPDGLAGLLLAVDEANNVVGFINRTFMEWSINGEIMIIPTLSDLAVKTTYRTGGAGLRLILKATSNCAHAFVNGSNANSTPLFHSLGYQSLDGARWLKKILNPIWGGFRYGWHKLQGGLPKPHQLFAQNRHPDACNIRTYFAPPADTLKQLTEFLNGSEQKIKQHWTIESVRWRFFDPSGPTHLLLIEDNAKGTIINAMVISVGPTRGINVCRLVAHRSQSISDFHKMLEYSVKVAKVSGVDAFFAFSFDQLEVQAIGSAGFTDAKQSPGTFFYHKRKKDAESFRNVLVQGAGSDYGFEAISRSEVPPEKCTS